MVTTETCADLATCPLGDRTVQLRARALQRCESASLHWVDWGAEGSALNDHFPLQAAGFGQALWSLWPCSFTCSVQFSSVAQSCPALCDPMDCSTPGLPVHHQLPEFTH